MRLIGYFLDGTNKIAIGYREVNFFFAREKVENFEQTKYLRWIVGENSINKLGVCSAY